MKIQYTTIVLSCLLSSATIAGGDPKFVHFQENYAVTDTAYSTINRQNDKQVAVLYANDPALESIQHGNILAEGARITMEVYKVLTDEEGNKLLEPDGLYKKGKLAAVAVMEKRTDWDENFPEDHRVGGWGFAIYTPDGQVKENDLDCVTCHAPLAESDYMFTHSDLKASVKSD